MSTLEVTICDGCGERVEHAKARASTPDALLSWRHLMVTETNKGGHTSESRYDACGECFKRAFRVFLERRGA